MVDHLFLHYPLTLGCGTNYSDWLIWTKFLLGVYVTWWPSHIKNWEAPLGARFLGKPLVSLWFGLCDGQEMLRFFGIRQGLQRLFGISFISLPPFGPFAPQLLRAFPLMWFNLIRVWCVVRKVCTSKEGLLGRKFFFFRAMICFVYIFMWYLTVV